MVSEALLLLQQGSPLFLIGLLISVVKLTTIIKSLQEDVREIKNGAVWAGECNARHDEVNRRLKRLEIEE